MTFSGLIITILNLIHLFHSAVHALSEKRKEICDWDGTQSIGTPLYLFTLKCTYSIIAPKWNYYYNANTKVDCAMWPCFLCIVCVVWELPRQASCGPLYLSKVLERDWCLLKPCRPARWPLMGTVLILSKCTRLLLWTSREREERKSRAKKGSRREKEKKRGKECEKNWKTDQQEPESKISKKQSIPAGGRGLYQCRFNE